jgi:alanyl-tRNA synthetase
VALAENPPAILLAASPESGVRCGETLKRLLAAHGGRGGGNATLAQGSLPSKESLDTLAQALGAELGLSS